MTGLPASIGLFAIPELRFLLADLAKIISERSGSRVHLYCRSNQEVEFYSSTYRDGRFASVTFADQLMRVRLDANLNRESVLFEALRFEELLGTTINRFAVANRQLGRGYMIGGYHHPRSKLTESRGLLALYDAYVAQLGFWESEIKSKALGLMIGGMPEAAAMCRRMGVQFRALRHARYRNLHYWSPDEFSSFPKLKTAFDEAPAGQDAIRIAEPYLTEIALRSKFEAENRLSVVLRDILFAYLQYSSWVVRGFERAKQTSVHENAAHLVRRWRDTQRVTSARMTRLSALRGTPFVFFPLQTEPEMTLLQNSPEYFFQLEAILSLARALPSGTKLVVKEALFAVGRRPSGFYDQIERIPNVVHLDLREKGVDVAAEASAVATISSTAGMEALIMGKPVLLFGRHNYFDFLPHALRVRSADELPALLKSAFSKDFDSARARSDGGRFLAAVEKSAFSLGQYDYLNLRSYEHGDVVRAFDALQDPLPTA